MLSSFWLLAGPLQYVQWAYNPIGMIRCTKSLVAWLIEIHILEIWAFFFWIRWEIFKRPQEQFKPYVLKQRFNLYSYIFCFNKILLGKESEIKWPTSITLFWFYSFQKGLKQTVITSKIPATKRSMERFLFCVKALLHTTSSGCSFWMGMQYTSLVFLWVFFWVGWKGSLELCLL